jgi:hypothetical protein
MIALKDLIVLNNNWLKVMEEANDTVDSWDPANYADEPCLDNPEMQLGVQPWSRGKAGCNAVYTERDYQADKASKLVDPNPSRSINLWG